MKSGRFLTRLIYLTINKALRRAPFASIFHSVNMRVNISAVGVDVMPEETTEEKGKMLTCALNPTSTQHDWKRWGKERRCGYCDLRVPFTKREVRQLRKAEMRI